MSKADFFISYASDDRLRAFAIKKILEKGRRYVSADPLAAPEKIDKVLKVPRRLQLRSWIDVQCIPFGSSWLSEITGALTECRWIVCLVGNSYFSRPIEKEKGEKKDSQKQDKKEEGGVYSPLVNHVANNMGQLIRGVEPDLEKSAEEDETPTSNSPAQVREITRLEMYTAISKKKLLPIVLEMPSDSKDATALLKGFHYLDISEVMSQNHSINAEQWSYYNRNAEALDIKIKKQSKIEEVLTVRVKGAKKPFLIYRFEGVTLREVRRLRGMIVETVLDRQKNEQAAIAKRDRLMRIKLSNSLLVPAIILALLLVMPLSLGAYSLFEETNLFRGLFSPKPATQDETVTLSMSQTTVYREFLAGQEDFRLDRITTEDLLLLACNDGRNHYWPVHQADDMDGGYDCAVHLAIAPVCDTQVRRRNSKQGVRSEFPEIFVNDIQATGQENLLIENLFRLCNLDEYCIPPSLTSSGHLNRNWTVAENYDGSGDYPAQIGQDGSYCGLNTSKAGEFASVRIRSE